MYRINLYPEHLANRQRARQRVARVGLFSLLLAIEALLLVAMAVSSYLLRDQSRTLQTEVQRLEARVAGQPADDAALGPARELVGIRRARIDWAPKLAALSETIDPALRIVTIEGTLPDKNRPRQLKLTGLSRDESSQREGVARFIDALRADRRIVADFPVIRLGTIQSGESSRFEVVGESGGEDS